MGSGIRGLLTGALTLVALQVLVSSSASKRVAGLFKVPGDIAQRFIDPTVPAIPDRGAADDEPQSLLGGLRDRPPPTAQYPDPFTPRRPSPVPSPGGD